MEEILTIEDLKNLLQKFIDEGKGHYQVRSAEFEYHIPTKDFFAIDDENKLLWYSA